MGTPAAAVPTLERIIADGHQIVGVYTQPDRPSGRGNKLTASPVKETALAHGLEVHQPLKIKTPEALELFRSHDADVAVVVAYGRILPASFLNAYRFGAINVHFSLLPKYRGAAPVNWAIVNGEAKTGVTTMQMDAGLDTGDIILQTETAIGDEETSVELMTRLADVGAELLAETLGGIESLPRFPQNHDGATFAPIMKKEDGLIDWTRDAASIAARVRGFQPFPTSFSRFDDKKLTFWKASATENTAHHPSGTIVDAKGDLLTVACGAGTLLKVEELQIEGKRRMSVRDFLNGVKLAPGTILG